MQLGRGVGEDPEAKSRTFWAIFVRFGEGIFAAGWRWFANRTARAGGAAWLALPVCLSRLRILSEEGVLTCTA